MSLDSTSGWAPLREPTTSERASGRQPARRNNLERLDQFCEPKSMRSGQKMTSERRISNAVHFEFWVRLFESQKSSDLTFSVFQNWPSCSRLALQVMLRIETVRFRKATSTLVYNHVRKSRVACPFAPGEETQIISKVDLFQ